MQHSPRGRLAAVLALSLVALFAMTAVASASTLTREGGSLTWTADEAINNSVNLVETEEGTLEISTTNDPIEDPLPAGCTDTDGDVAAPHTVVTCTGVGNATFLTLDGDDYLYAGVDVETIELVLRGGEGSDSLYGGFASDEVYGEGGDDDTIAGEWNNNGTQGGSDDLVDGGDGDEGWIAGGPGNDTVLGGAGNDYVVGGRGDDFIDGGDGDDGGDTGYLIGGAGNDIINGGAGNDSLSGDCDFPDSSPGDCGETYPAGNDTLNGGAGDDYLIGGGGDDVENGDDGDDTFDADFYDNSEPGNDTYNGGNGIDRIYYDNDDTPEPVTVDITQDGVANDGVGDEADNVGGDIEDIYVEGEGIANVEGGGAINGIYTGEGNDTVNPGANNDFVFTNEGDDTINAVDGYADRIDCGEDGDDLNDDADVANVDEYDAVASNCETVNVTRLNRFAEEDAQPGISWVNPATDGTLLPTDAATRLTVNATDDKGIAQVIFLAGNRVLCNDTVAPYECDYTPTADDVGETTLVAIAIDTAQQTTVALRYVELDRFELDGLSFRVTPKKDLAYPLKFRARGALDLPAGVSAEEGCKGRITTQWKIGKKTISTRRAKVKPDCTWSVRNKFGEQYRITGRKLRVFAVFNGNDVLQRERAGKRKVTVKKGGTDRS